MEQPQSQEPVTTPPPTEEPVPAGAVDDSIPESDDAVEHDDDLDAGFNAARGIESSPKAKPDEDKPTDAPAPQATAKAEEAKPVKPEPDPWEGVSPVVRKAIEGLQPIVASFEDVQKQIRSLHGHVGNLTAQQKEIKGAIAQAKTATEASGAQAPTQAQIDAAGKTGELWKQLKEDYPDWAEAVDARLAEIAAKQAPTAAPVDVQKLMQDVDQRIAARASTTSTQSRTLGFIDAKLDGPEWEQEIKSPEFDAWYRAQDKDTQALGDSAKAGDAVKLITKFREAKAAQAKAEAARAERNARLQRAVQPAGTAVTEVVEDDEKAFESGFSAVRSG